MRTSLQRLPLLALHLVHSAWALEFVSRSDGEPPRCSPVFAPSWLVPSTQRQGVFLELKPSEGTPTEHPFGYVIYAYRDEPAVGIVLPGDSTKAIFCTEKTIGKGNCTRENIGHFLGGKSGKHPIQHGWHDATQGDVGAIQHANFTVTATGLYCVRIINPDGVPLAASVEFRQPYGRLHPDLYPLFKATSILLICYLVVLVIWTALSLQHRKHLTLLQNYMGIVLLLSAGEMALSYLLYYGYNASGEASKATMLAMMTVGAIRSTSVLFFLLLISMGYGVVTANLGERAKSIYALTTLHLIFALFTNLSMAIGLDRGRGSALLASVPISITFSIFFSWTLSSLAATKDSLAIRKQTTKLVMYQKLTCVLYASFVLASLCMLGAAVAILTQGGDELAWYARNWDWLWFYSSGWSMLLNLAGCLVVGWIFRPRAYNRNHGLNELSAFPLDEEDLENRASIALDILRSGQTHPGSTRPPAFAPLGPSNPDLQAFGDVDDLEEESHLARKS